jgi:U3 small nucleolar RNA-associated protein 5
MSTKRKLPQKLAQPKVNQSAKPLGKGKFDDSRAVISGGGNTLQARTNGTHEVVEISSDGSEEEEEEDEDASADESADEEAVKSIEGLDVTMTDANAAAPVETEENAEPSFGELVRANALEPIDVAAAFEPSEAVTFPKSSNFQPPSGTSLGTVLTQSLRTNDTSLLETCLQTSDVQVIRATIQRLESPLAGTLLRKLAERLHRRPGRSGSLMVWVQWTLVTHGGYLATQADLVKQLSELNKVIDERARGLQPLLSLKGKLDMLEAQIQLRKSMQHQRTRMEEDEDDEAVIYVEGQESDAEDQTVTSQQIKKNGGLQEFSDDGSEISEDMPMTNGVIADSDDDESSDGNDLLDDEAEETDNDSGDEDQVDHEDYDTEAEESDEADAAPPSKLQRVRK